MADPKLLIEVAAKDETTKVLKGIESSIIRFVGAVSATIAAINVTLFPIATAAEFQREMLNVAKTTDFTTVQIERLSEGLKGLATNMNVSAIDLAKIAAAGGQLGLGKEGVDGLLAYTESTARFAAVLDVTVEEAGVGIGKLSNLFGIAIKDAERISSTLNEISNNSTASGRELIDIIQRIGTAGGTLSLQQSAALAAYGKDLGLTSETVGTTLNKVFLDLQSKAAEVAPLVGLTVTEFANLVKTDGVAAFKLYIDSLRKMDNVSRAIISEQITGGGRIAAFTTAAVNDAASGFELLDRELLNTKKGFDSGTSAITEHAKVMTGLLAQVQILRNVFSNLAETIGKAALPYLTALAQQLQELGKNPEFTRFFVQASQSIGSVVTGVISFIRSLADLGFVLGPLLRLLGAFVAVKLAQAVIGMGASLYRMAAATAVATQGWASLLTMNLSVISAMAATADAVDANNAALVAQGKTATSQVSLLGRAAQQIRNFFAPVQAAQETYRQAEERLNQTIKRRNAFLQTMQARMNKIAQSAGPKAIKAYNDAFTATGDRTAARNALNASVAASGAEAQRLSARGNAALAAYDARIRGLGAAHTAAAAQAVAMGSTIRGVMFGIVGAVRSAITTVFALGQSFLVVASRILGALFIVQYLAEAFGVLEPALKFLRETLGIRTEADAAAARAAQERDAQLAEERKRASELAKEYENLKKAWDKQIVDPKSSRVEDLGRQLEIVKGKLDDMGFTSQEFTANMAYSAERAVFLSSKITEMEAKLTKLQAGKGTTDLLAIGQEILLPALPVDLDRGAKEIENTRQELIELKTEYALVQQAQKSYADNVNKNADELSAVRGREATVLSELAAAYNAEGFALLKALEVKIAKQEELAASEKALAEAQRDNKATSSDRGELAQFVVLDQKVRQLKTELSGLAAGFDELYKNSSIAAVGFLNTLNIDATTVAVDKVRKAITEFGGIAGEGLDVLNRKFLDSAKEIAKVEEALAKADASRRVRLSNVDLGGKFLTGEERLVEENKINQQYGEQIAKLKEKLALHLATRDNAARELQTARTLRDAYGDGTKAGTTQEQSARRVRDLLASSTSLALTKQQIAAQKTIVDNATFNAARMKDRYEASLKDVSKAINDVASDMAGLTRVFATRTITLRLAAFDSAAERQTQFFRDAQQKMVEDERKRLEALGLSSDEISDQVRSFERMLDFAGKIRQEGQDEQRQAIVLNDLRSRIAEKEAEALESQKTAARLSAAQNAALDRGDKVTAGNIGKEIAVEADIAKTAIGDMRALLDEFKAEANKPINTPLGAKFVVAKEELTDMVRRVSTVGVEVTNSTSKSLEAAARGATEVLNTQQATMKALEGDVARYEAEVAKVVGKNAELAKIQTLIGEKMLAQLDGAAGMADILKSIANADFRGITEFNQLASQEGAIRNIQESVDAMATRSANKIVSLTTSMSELPRALKAVFELTAEEVAKADTVARQAAERAISDSAKAKLAAEAPVDAKVNFDARTSLQAELDSGGPFTAKVKLDSSAGAQRNAGGGHIRGPGTSTSDSILSWLSNGEYVSDAKTTSFFGPSFFAALKAVARGGPASAARFFSAFSRGPRLPAFSAGGQVTSSVTNAASQVLASAMGEGSRDTVNVTLDVGGKKIAMRAERDQANELVRTIRNLSRSS